MNQFTSASFHNGILRYRNLTVGDVRPDSTSKLYRRMFKATGRKYIPVKDITADTMGRELNAYLINPEYIDKSVLDPVTVSNKLTPSPVIPVLQYSRITYTRPTPSTMKRVIKRAAALYFAAVNLGQRAISSVKPAAATKRFSAIKFPLKRTYSLQSGMALKNRQKIFIKSSSLVAILSLGIIGYSSLDFKQPVQPTPVATSNSLVENPITTSVANPSIPVPIYSGTHSSPSTQSSSPITNRSSISSQRQGAASPVIVPDPSLTETSAAQPIESPATTVETPTQPQEIISPEQPSVSEEPVTIIEQPILVDPIETPIVENIVDSTSTAYDGVTTLVGDVLGQ